MQTMSRAAIKWQDIEVLMQGLRDDMGKKETTITMHSISNTTLKAI